MPVASDGTGLDSASQATNLLAGVRQKYPQYKDIPDAQLADGLYKKFYASKMTRESFDAKVGLAPAAPQPLGDPDKMRPAPNMLPTLPDGKFSREGYAPPNAGLDQKALFEQREKVPKGSPEYIELTKKIERAQQDINAEAMSFLPVGTVGKGVVGLIGKGAEALRGKGGSLIENVTGAAARKALGEVRSEATSGAAGASAREEAGVAAKTAEAEALKAQQKTAAEQGAARAAALRKQQEQLRAQQPVVATQRAEARALPAKPGQPGAEPKAVLSRLQEGVGTTAKELEGAKGATAAAKAGASAAETELDSVKQAASQLDQQLMEKPGISKEQFGAELEKAVRETNKKYRTIRAKEADYGGVLDRAGDHLTVDTSGIADRIDEIVQKNVRNPTTRKQLLSLKNELSNAGEGEEAVDKLSLRQADSLRKTLDEAVNKEIYAGDAVSKEAAVHLKEVRKALTEAATEAHPEYREALGKFSTHSRPLEFIEKNPLLRKVVVDNPAATEAAVTRAQIVGKLVTEANRAGRQALSRLLIESPELRKSARLYFSQDLFGPAGLRDMKSPGVLRNWLAKNEAALKQLGIFDEFKDIRTARLTAQKAVDIASGAAKQSKAMIAKSEAAEKAIQDRLTKQSKLRDLQQKRVGTLEKGRAETLDAAKQRSTQRAAEGEKRLGKRAEEAGKSTPEMKELGKRADKATLTAAQKQAQADSYRQAHTELNAATVEELPGKADVIFKRMRADGHINDAQYAKLIRLVDEAKAAQKSTAALRTRIKRIAEAAILAYGGYELFRAVRGIAQ